MNKRILTIRVSLVVVLLLAGAAFVGGQLFTGNQVPDDLLPATELPQTRADRCVGL
jgi:hypothetical protein